MIYHRVLSRPVGPIKMSLLLALQRVTQQVQEAAPGRAVTILAVSKGQSAAAIRTLAQAGQRDFGENYLQEALEKQLALADLKSRSRSASLSAPVTFTPTEVAPPANPMT